MVQPQSHSQYQDNGFNPDSKHWELLKNTSRTFYLSIKKLPGMLAEAVCLSYLILRISDFFEDNNYMETSEKIRWLKEWDEVLGGSSMPDGWQQGLAKFINENPDAYAAFHGQDIISLFRSLPSDHQDAIQPHVRATTLGMARWVQRGPEVQNEEDMDDYMHEVAGRVGYLVTDLFSLYSPQIANNKDDLMPLARQTGLALQTVNIIRGLRKDFERGWIFVPESYCESVGIDRNDLFSTDYRIKALEVLSLLTRKAERHLEAAILYLKSLPVTLYRVRLAVIWPVLFAARTLALSRENYGVFTGEVKMQRNEVESIVRKTSFMGWSNRFLERYYNDLLIV